MQDCNARLTSVFPLLAVRERVAMFGNYLRQRTAGGPGELQAVSTDSKKLKLSVLQLQLLNPAHSHRSREACPSPKELLGESPGQVDTLSAALQGTQLSCAWTPDSQNCEIINACDFMLLSLW